MQKNVPVALTIAGSDSGGGAGIQADLKAFSALGVYGASVVTAVTAQNTRAVTDVHEIPADTVSAQISAVLDDLDVAAIKIGMLFSPEIVRAVSEGLGSYDGPVVLDPVMIAKSCDALLQDEAIAALKAELLPRADLLTPNLPEAACLLALPEAADETAAGEQGRALLTLGARAVLVKGGHGSGKNCTDFLIEPEGKATRLTAPRIDTRNTHGTGCTYSSAIAAHLALGRTLEASVTAAHDYLHKAILASDALQVGGGHGPVHHFHNLWG